MPDTTLGVEAARRRLPELLERAPAGERIVIQRHRQLLYTLYRTCPTKRPSTPAY